MITNIMIKVIQLRKKNQKYSARKEKQEWKRENFTFGYQFWWGQLVYV